MKLYYFEVYYYCRLLLTLFIGPAPIGYPRNVAAKPLDDGLLVIWEPPEFGMQLFKTYIVRYTYVIF